MGGEARLGSWILLSEDGESWANVCIWGACVETFNNISDLRSHVLQHHLTEQIYSGFLACGVRGCHFQTSDDSRFNIHVLFHLYLAALQEKGIRVVQSVEQLRGARDCGFHRSLPLEYSGDPLICQWDECNRVFKDFEPFFEHVECHGSDMDASDRNDDNRFRCLWIGCKCELTSKRLVREHLRHHSGRKRSACPFCASTFYDTRTKLVDHMLRKSFSSETARLKCFICQQTFSTQRLLREHSRRHVKHYKCPMCDMTVETPSDIRRHIQARHANQKTHLCLHCNKGFNGASNLQRHMKVHLGSELFQCDVCSFSCRTKWWFQKHQLKHQEPGKERTYLCHICPGKYGSGQLLSKHLKQKHHIKVPSGHSRFYYKKCADGFFRLQTERYESPELAQQLEAQSEGAELVQVQVPVTVAPAPGCVLLDLSGMVNYSSASLLLAQDNFFQDPTPLPVVFLNE